MGFLTHLTRLHRKCPTFGGSAKGRGEDAVRFSQQQDYMSGPLVVASGWLLVGFWLRLGWVGFWLLAGFWWVGTWVANVV